MDLAKRCATGLLHHVLSIVCVCCGEEKPAGGFVSKRKSVPSTRNCLTCCNQPAFSFSSFSHPGRSVLTPGPESRCKL
ncbi:Uncharacterized protein HZ326_29718 [Fusarium oxysporum f. sp. albedinis]|nr:Uncharacterized protein HZ326_29718 [Fusarium oxysporum f. sp. albedinis]